MNLTNRIFFRSAVGIIISLAVFLSGSQSFASTIEGSVKFKGISPKLKKIKMSADPQCIKLNPNDVFPDKLTVNKNGTLQFAFVYIKEGLPKKPYPAAGTPVILDQSGCVFSPHVLGVQVGQTLRVRNGDPTFHNIHAMPQTNPQFNVGLANKDQSADKVYNKPEMGIKIGCDVHPWMRAWVNVMEHPFFSTTDSEGKFSIKDVPPGKYTVTVWHEELGSKDAQIEVTAEKNAVLDFELAADNNKGSATGAVK